MAEQKHYYLDLLHYTDNKRNIVSEEIFHLRGSVYKTTVGLWGPLAQESWSPAARAVQIQGRSWTPENQRSLRVPCGGGWRPTLERGRGCRVWTPHSTASAKWFLSGVRTINSPNMRRCRWPWATLWPSTESWLMPADTQLLRKTGWIYSLTAYSQRPILALCAITPLWKLTVCTPPSPITTKASKLSLTDKQWCVHLYLS